MDKPKEQPKKEDKKKGVEKTPTPEELEKEREKEMKKLLGRYVKPHKKKAREVTTKDIKRVLEEAHVLYLLCYIPRGVYKSAHAVAHNQIEQKDPLRLFVTVDKKLIINPVIVRHTRHTVDSEEGCMSYPEKKMVTVQRWNKCEVEYKTLRDMPNEKGERKPVITGTEKISLSGRDSFVWQHEIDHLDGKYIYDN